MHIIAESCRVCLGKQRLKDIFNKNIPEKIKYCATVELSQDDGLPQMICTQCLFYLEVAYIFRTVCEATDVRIRQQLAKVQQNVASNTKTQTTRFTGNFHYIKGRSYIIRKDKPPIISQVVTHKTSYVSSSENEKTPRKESNESYTVMELINEVVIGESPEKTEEIPLQTARNDNVVERSESPKTGRHVIQSPRIDSPVKAIAVRSPKKHTPLDINKSPNQTTPQKSVSTVEMKESPRVGRSSAQSPKIDRIVEVKESPKVDAEVESPKIARTRSPRHSPVEINDSPKMGRHTARKKSAKILKKVPTVHETFEERMRQLECEMHMREEMEKAVTRHVTAEDAVLVNKAAPVQDSVKPKTPFKCVICNKDFSSVVNLQKHRKTHSSDTRFQCKYCPKKMKHLTSLKLHEKRHSYKPEYVCDVCSKTFNYKSALAMHKKTHQKAKNVCKTCGKSFANESVLQKHEKVHRTKHKFNFKIQLRPERSTKRAKK